MAETIVMQCQNKALSLEELGEVLCEAFEDSEMVFETKQLNDSALMLCFERTYFQNGNYSALTVMITEEADAQKACIIGFGGEGSYFNLNLGASMNFAEGAAEVLQAYGFDESIF